MRWNRRHALSLNAVAARPHPCCPQVASAHKPARKPAHSRDGSRPIRPPMADRPSFQTLGCACRMSRLLQHLSQIASRRAPVEHARVSARLPCGIAPTEDIAHRTIRCGRWLRVDASRSAENRHGQVAIDFVSPLRLRGYGRRSALHRMREGDSAAEVGNIQGRAGSRAFSVCLRRHVLGHLRTRRCERNRRSLAIERARSGLR